MSDDGNQLANRGSNAAAAAIVGSGVGHQSAGVTVHSDANFGGRSAPLAVGQHVLNPELDNTISSVRVPAGYTVTLYDAPDFTGQELTLTGDVIQLDNAFNDRTSSIVVTAGAGARNASMTASVDNSHDTAIRQDNVSVTFTNLW
jgi:hypothetical protein